MDIQLNWLPPLVLFNDFRGNWDIYLEALYQFFYDDFIESSPQFEGVRVGLKRYPVTDGKESAFWHLISGGENEPDRLPDLRKCEHIRWPRPIIEHSFESVIKIWENERKGEKSICIWLESRDFLVVLRKRNGYLLFWTAYPIEQDHRKNKLKKEYLEYNKNYANSALAN